MGSKSYEQALAIARQFIENERSQGRDIHWGNPVHRAKVVGAIRDALEERVETLTQVDLVCALMNAMKTSN